MNLVLIGAPGSGKGTLAQQIEKDFGYPQISSGDMLREEVKKGTALALKIKKIMESGEFVPDEIITRLIKRRISKKDCEKGFVLDGYPRSVPQAKLLEKITKLDCAVLIDVPFDEIKKRLLKRRVCPNCKKIFNTDFCESETCTNCGARLVKREDDAPEIIENRFKIYAETSAPLLDFYKSILFKIDPKYYPNDTYAPIYKLLKKEGN